MCLAALKELTVLILHNGKTTGILFNIIFDFFDDLGGHAAHDAVIRHVLGNHRFRDQCGEGMHRDRRQGMQTAATCGEALYFR